MDKALKQRLLGAVMLVSLMVVFLPLVLDGGDHRKTMQTLIPPRPGLPNMQINEPQRLHLTAAPELDIVEVESVSLSESEPEPEPVADPIAKPVAPAAGNKAVGLDSERRVKAWVLQLASFKQTKNANGLRDKLRKGGYKAYSEKRNGLIRVFVGPDLDKSKVEGWKKALKQQFKLSGLIKRSYPGDS